MLSCKVTGAIQNLYWDTKRWVICNGDNASLFWLFSYLMTHSCVVQYIPRNMHTVFALLCFVVVIHGLIFPYPPGLLHWHCGNLTIAPVPAKQPWWIWINTSCEFILNDCITTTKQSTTQPCAYFLGYTVDVIGMSGNATFIPPLHISWLKLTNTLVRN